MRTHERNGQVKAVSQGSGQLWRTWRDYVEGGSYPWGVTNGVTTTDVFSQMQGYAGSMPTAMHTGLGRATRITIYRKKLEDIILPASALTTEVRAVFRPNRWSNPESVHGPVGSASLVLLVPKGKRVTVIKGKQVRAYDLQGSISFIESTCGEVADIKGDVELFDSALETARNIRGKLCQRYYRYFGARMDGYKARRLKEAEDCQLEDIRGGVDIDVSNVQLKAARLGGPGADLQPLWPNAVTSGSTRRRQPHRIGIVRGRHSPLAQRGPARRDFAGQGASVCVYAVRPDPCF